MRQTTTPPADHRGRRPLIGALVVGVTLGGVTLIPKAYDSYTQHQEAKASASASAYASAQASATNAVPDGIQVCELLDSTDLEERTGLQILYYTMARFYNDPVPILECNIYFDQPNSDVSSGLTLYYTTAFAPEISLAESEKEIADDSTVQPIDINGLPGEAVSYMSMRREKITWRSPKGAEMSIGFTAAKGDIGTEDPEGTHEILLHVLYQVAPIIDEVAAGPQILPTAYPSRPAATPTP